MEEEGLLKKKRQEHPINTSGFIAKLFFCWLPPYLAKGLKKNVSEDDMYRIAKTQRSDYLGDKLNNAWRIELTKENPSLFRAIFIVHKYQLFMYAFINLVIELLKIAQPLLISKLVTYFQQSVSHTEEIYYNAALLIFVTVVQVITVHHFQLAVMQLGMKMRIAACALIYRKSLKLNQTALAGTTIGQMVNLLSNDVGRFDFTCQHIQYLWLSPFATLICIILLYKSVGITGLAGSGTLLCFIPVQIYMAKLTSNYRIKTALRTDERVRLMNEIISGIQVIKMYTWEKPFTKLLELVRNNEMSVIRKNALIKGIAMTFAVIVSRAAILTCILAYVLSGNALTAAYAYTITSYYTYLRILVTLYFPQALTQFAETKVSISRIQKFLLYDELQPQYISKLDLNRPDLIDSHLNGVQIKNLSAKWINSSSDYTLQNVTFEARPNQLVALIGPVGAGKSTLLQVILRELKNSEGIVRVTGSVSYASQEPWVFGSSIRQNILFGLEYDEKKYTNVIKVCALERDFSLFPHGDRTLIGERGSSLSGGQRARINLARAIYKEADIYLLDDPLAAVDSQVGQQLFTRCIRGYLKKKCVILVTHQLQYLDIANYTYLLENGKIKAAGVFDNLKNSNIAFIKMLTTTTADKTIRLSRKISKTESVNSLHFEEFSEIIDKEREETKTGCVSRKVYKNYLRAGGPWILTIALTLCYILTQAMVTLCDLFLTLWVNVEQWWVEQKIKLDHPLKLSNYNITLNTNVVSKTDYDIEKYLSILMKKIDPILVYSLLVFVIFILALIRSIYSFRFSLAASTKIHNDMFKKIVYSPMSFFNTNPCGRILNRFSKDIGILDEILPQKIADSLWMGLTVISVTLVIGVMNPWILLPTSVISIMFYFLRKIFLVSSRNIKRVEAVTRSPIFTHLAASIQGLTTVRAFQAEKILTKEFDKFQDAYTSAYYMFLTANRGFGFWLDLQCAVYIGLVVVSIIFIKNETFAGNVGLILTQAITLSSVFQWVLRELSELENQMTSAERTQEYADLIIEPNDLKTEPPHNWPWAGKIEFQKVSLQYLNNSYVLKNLSFEIKPKEKVGIVGRTGAGKSSLVQAMFRLADIEGKVLLDDIDINAVDLNKLRSNISIIPQEPVLFSGTLRKNLDLFDQYSDDILWDALEEVKLKQTLNELPDGLFNKMAEGGSNFSVGQRQLLCLARAIVRNNRILILDEATANVDPMTDSIIQNTIRSKFAECTVLTIAHRLNTIIDSDKVLVMDAGVAVEFDHPYVLLEKKGVFYNLVKQTGEGMTRYLEKIAKENYLVKYNSKIDV